MVTGEGFFLFVSFWVSDFHHRTFPDTVVGMSYIIAFYILLLNTSQDEGQVLEGSFLDLPGYSVESEGE